MVEGPSPFKALIASHTALRQARSGAITAKAGAVSAAQSAIDACEAWLTRAYANLDAAGRADAGIGQAVATARGRRVDGLYAEVDAALAACQAHKAALDPDCQPDALIAAGTAAVAAYREALPAKASAKAAPVEDTEEIDFADGQLLELITALNDAARKAFRASGVRAKVSAYKYHHLRGRPSDTADDAPPVAEPAKPAG